MNKTKTIYFLSAVVLIIGCYALNLSYSLFVRTEEKEIVNSTVPYLAAELSLTSLEVEAGKEYLIKQTVSNTGTASMNYAINTNSTSTNCTVQAVTDGTNTYKSIGTLSSKSTTDLYFVVSNTGTETITINFTLDKNYTTLTNNLTTNIDNDNTYFISAGIPYSDNQETLAYHIINQYVSSDLYTGTASEGLSSLFDEGINKVELPITSGGLNIEGPEFDSIATSELGLFQAEDDYGTSYYYRGASTVNYVSFAGFTWRIVRINGDGSIRLVLEGSLDKVTKDGESSPVYKNSSLTALESDGVLTFNTAETSNAFLGYMRPNISGIYPSTYDETHKNVISSTIKTYVDTFYEEYLLSYQDYLADTLFCGDKTRADGYTTLGYGGTGTFYKAYDRLEKNTTATPTLECASNEKDTDTLTEEQRAYSRYTSSIDADTTTSKGVSINNDLTYPIALLSADEVVMAGAAYSTKNTGYYLYGAYKNALSYDSWWTMTPSNFNGTNSIMFISTSSSASFSKMSILYTAGVRPVINLKAGILVNSGAGTSGNPYTVKAS